MHAELSSPEKGEALGFVNAGSAGKCSGSSLKGALGVLGQLGPALARVLLLQQVEHVTSHLSQHNLTCKSSPCFNHNS